MNDEKGILEQAMSLLERIAAALERGNEMASEMVQHARYHRKRVESRDAGKSGIGEDRAEPLPEVPEAGSAPSSPIPEEPNRNFLLDRCREIGIEVPPRTKTNTLIKWLAASEKSDRDELVALCREREIDVPPNFPLEVSKETPSRLLEETPGVGEADGQNPVILLEKFRDTVSSLCSDPPTPEETETLKALLRSFGGGKLKDVPVEKYPEFVEAFRRSRSREQGE